MSDATEPDADALAALGRVPSGLFVLTARASAGETGMLASWVQQCSFAPAQLTVALNNARPLAAELTDGARFVLNVIPDGNKALVAHFGKGFEPGEPAFDGLDVLRDGDGPPALRAAHAYLVCAVANRVPAGDHTLLVARVTGGAVLSDARPAVHVRKSGLRY